MADGVTRRRGRPRSPPTKPVPSRRARGTGSVFTRGDGRVGCILPRALDPKRRPIYSSANRRGFTTEAEAAAWISAEIVRRSSPPPAQASGAETLGAYLARWHADHAPFWPARTARAYRRSLARLVELIGSVSLNALTHEVILGALARQMELRWQRTRRDGTPTSAARPYSRRTLAQGRMVLGYALADLVPDVLPTNPVRRTNRLPRGQAPEQPVWDGDQADRFLEAAEEGAPHLALAYRLILRRALRVGEVVALQWTEVNEARSVVLVRTTAGDRTGERADTKGRREREIPLSADLVRRLISRREAQARPSPWVFTNPETGLPYDASRLRRLAVAVCQAAQLPPINPKDMRATCATVLLDEGVPLAQVSALLGHSSIAITAVFYARVLRRREERIGQLAEAFDRAHERGAISARGSAPAPFRRAE